MSASFQPVRERNMKANSTPVLNSAGRLAIKFISVLCFGLFSVATVAQAFVWSDDLEETEILIGVGLWSGSFDAILGIVGLIAASKNHRKIVKYFMLTAIASMAFSVAMIVLPIISLIPSEFSKFPLQVRDAISSRTWRWVLVGNGCLGLLLSITASIISGLSIRICDEHQRKQRREEHSKEAQRNSQRQSSDVIMVGTAITIIITGPEEEIQPEDIKESAEVETEAEVESRSNTVLENDSLDPEQSRVMPAEDSVPESMGENESGGYESVSTSSGGSPKRLPQNSSLESSKPSEEPIYAIPNKKKGDKTVVDRSANEDFEIQVDNGQHISDSTPPGPFQWQLERRWQEDDHHPSSSVASQISNEEDSSSSSLIELTKDDIIIHPPPIHLPQSDLTDEVYSKND